LKHLVFSLLLVASSVVGAGALTVASGKVAAVPARASTGLDIYVGYADDLRASPTNFPTPWQGAPNTVFIGSGPPWDAGAVRLVNNSSSPVSVDDVSVDLHHGSGGASGPVFDLWGSFVIPANGQAILTQTTQFNFDTSDDPFETCGTTAPASDPRIPTVTVTVSGSPTTVSDAGHILDTGGFDAVCLGNESIQWTLAGNAPCAGSSLSLAPPSQTQSVGQTATVTATFANSCGQPLSNVAVNFSVISGPNTGTSGAGVTDSNGQASFSYSSLQPGTDTLQASVTNPAGTITSNSVTVTWVLQFAPGGGSFVIGDLESAVGTSVTFWESQWGKDNPTSTGSKAAAFKGFAESPTVPACPGTWSADPGNSTPPPSGPLPAYMGVIVTSSYAKSGSTISGDILEIVVVKTDPGYQPDPGHAGTGTVVAVVCRS
jgi:hypothetical protein